MHYSIVSDYVWLCPVRILSEVIQTKMSCQDLYIFLSKVIQTKKGLIIRIYTLIQVYLQTIDYEQIYFVLESLQY